MAIFNHSKEGIIRFLDDVVHAAILFCTKCTFDFNKRAYVVPPFLCGKIDVELEILYVRLSVEVVKVLEALLTNLMRCMPITRWH